MARALLLALAMLAASLSQAFAVQPDEQLSNPALEARARALSRELRCMVCQNQSIDDSDAPLARDLRLLVRERLKAGDSDAQILDFLVGRYGEFVLLRPRIAWHNAALWGAPLLVLLVGVGVAFAATRRQRVQAPPLTAEEERALRELTDRR
jgi:cytochrome c-type biogenesis protein CcmH